MDTEQRITEIFEGIKAKKLAPIAVFQGMRGIVRNLQSVIDEANAQEQCDSWVENEFRGPPPPANWLQRLVRLDAVTG